MTVSNNAINASVSGAAQNSSLIKGSPIRFQFGLDRPKPCGSLPGFEGTQKQAITIYVRGRLPQLHRGRKWSDYPITAPPVFDPDEKYLGFIWPSRLIDLTSAELKAALRDQPFFLYDETCMPRGVTAKWRVSYRFFAALLHQELCPGKAIRVRFWGQKEYRDVEVSELISVSAGWHYFQYNYKVNFAAIGLKAVDYVIDKFNPLPLQQVEPNAPYAVRLQAKNIQSIQRGYLEHHHSFLTDPWALQVLFALRNASHDEKSLTRAFFKQRYPLPRKGGIPLSFGQHVLNGHWIGTGKYGVQLNLQDEIGWVIHEAAALGLVDMEREGQVALTHAGEAFLDIMHTDNYDPDAFMRFLDPATLSIPESEIGRIDAWMTRFFRKMKVKVDKLR